MPSVSIIVTTCSSFDLLAGCLGTLRERTYVPKDLIPDLIVVSAEGDNETSTQEATSAGAANEDSIERLVQSAGGRLLTSPRSTPAASLNRGLAETAGDYVIFVHDDVTFEYSDWLVNILEALCAAGDIGVVGAKLLFEGNNLVENAGYAWSAEQRLFTNDYKLLPADHHLIGVQRDCVALSGALLACTKQLAKELEGFDASLPYGEDIDFCLRARKQGRRTIYSPFVVAHHKSGATRGELLAVPEPSFTENLRAAQSRLMAKWSKELEAAPHLFRNGAAIDRTVVVRWGSRKDVLMATPVLKALKDKYPQAQLAVATRYPEVLLDLPHVDRIFPDTAAFEEAYNRIVMLEYDKEPTRHPQSVYAEQAGVLLPESGKPEVVVTSEDRALAKTLVGDGRFAAIHVGPVPATRGWPLERFVEVAKYCVDVAGLQVVQVGTLDAPTLGLGKDLRGRLTVQQTAAVLQKATVFVGVDSLPSHLAQAVGAPSIVLYGCVNPELRMTNPEVVTPVFADIDCKWCFHRGPVGPTSLADCQKGRLECVELVSTEMVTQALSEKLKQVGQAVHAAAPEQEAPQEVTT